MLNRKIKNFKNYFSSAHCWTLVLLIISFSFLCRRIVSFSSDSFYFFNIFSFIVYLATLGVNWAHGSSISFAAMQDLICSMQSLLVAVCGSVVSYRIEFRPPVLGAWSLSHYSQANREVSWNWFKLKSAVTWIFGGCEIHFWWQQKSAEKTEFIILCLWFSFGCTSWYLQRI